MISAALWLTLAQDRPPAQDTGARRPPANASRSVLSRLRFLTRGVVRSDMKFEYVDEPCCYAETPTAWSSPWGRPDGGSTYPYLYLVRRGERVVPPVGMRSAVPLGGLGAGTVELRADGRLYDWNIFNNSPADGLKVQLGDAAFMLGVRCGGGKKRAWVLGPGNPWGLPATDRIEYSGAFPVSRLRIVDRGLPVAVDLYAYSEWHIRRPDASATPAAIFTLDVHNPLKTAVEVSFLLTVPNHIGGAWSFRNGAALGKAGSGPDSGSMTVACSGVAKAFSADDVPAMYRAFLKGAGRKLAHAAHGGAATSLKLGPGESGTVSLALAWRFPDRRHFGFVIGNRYARHYGGSAEVADKVLRRLPETWKGLEEWQRLCFDNDLPDWLQDALVNSAGTMFKTSMWSADGRYRQWESFSCAAIDPVHIHLYRSIPYTLFFPELQRNLFRGIAANQESVGFVRECLGWANTTFDQGGGRLMGDCGTAFILGTYANYLWTGDRAFLDELWPHVKRAAEWQIRRSEAFGLPNELCNTYDWWAFERKDVVSYNAFLHLASLRAAERMASVEGDAAFAAECRARAAAGREKLDELLWTGDYYRSWWMKGGGYPDALHADTLYGQLWACVLGLGSVAEPERMRSHLRAEARYNASRFGLTVMSKRSDEWIDKLVWQAGPLDWTSLSLYLGGDARSCLAEAQKVVSAWRDGVNDMWNWTDTSDSSNGMPWCNSHYARQLIFWTIPLALSGQRYDAAAGALSFAPAKGAPARLPWFTPQGNGVLERLSGGRYRFTVFSGRADLAELSVGSASATGVRLAGGGSVDLPSDRASR